MAEFWVVNGWLKASGLTPGSVEDSIEKWRALYELALAGQAIYDGGFRTCSLCQIYSTDETGCAGCPVWAKTGLFDCQGTPYGDYCEAIEARNTENAASAAERMIEFLSQIA